MGADRVALGKVLFGAKSITSRQLVCFALGHTAARPDFLPPCSCCSVLRFVASVVFVLFAVLIERQSFY